MYVVYLYFVYGNKNAMDRLEDRSDNTELQYTNNNVDRNQNSVVTRLTFFVF